MLEEGNRRALLGAADLGTFPRLDELSGFMDQLGEIVGCPRDHIMLNCSHSHGAATVSDERYREWLYEKVREAAQEASENASEGTLWYGEGKTSLPLNRRLERDGQVVNAPNPGGTVDDRMRLLVFRKPTGEIAALGMSVACHPVATGAQHLLTAEYPGAWRTAFSRAFGPDVTPFFLQGAGGDIRPRHVAEGDHWRAMKHAELPSMGRELLREMLKILLEANFKQIDNLTLMGKINRVEAPCQRLYTAREELELLEETGWKIWFLCGEMPAASQCGRGSSGSCGISRSDALVEPGFRPDRPRRRATPRSGPGHRGFRVSQAGVVPGIYERLYWLCNGWKGDRTRRWHGDRYLSFQGMVGAS